MSRTIRPIFPCVRSHAHRSGASESVGKAVDANLASALAQHYEFWRRLVQAHVIRATSSGHHCERCHEIPQTLEVVQFSVSLYVCYHERPEGTKGCVSAMKCRPALVRLSRVNDIDL